MANSRQSVMSSLLVRPVSFATASNIGTIAKRKAIDRFRVLSAANIHNAYTDEEEMAELVSDFSVDEHVDSSELRKILLQKIKELGEPDSAIIIQKYFYGQNANEIGRMLDMKPATVRMRCTRAIKKLRSLLRDFF